MKTMKQILSLMLAMCLLLGCIPVPAVAADIHLHEETAEIPETTHEEPPEPTEPETMPSDDGEPVALRDTEGSCGDNLTWTLSEDGVLRISGTGPMKDYSTNMFNPYASDTMPWSSSRSMITTIVVEEGVTSIGSCAFAECTNLKSISLPYGLINIKHMSFAGCENLASIDFPDTLEEIERYAFYGCLGFTQVNIPASITFIDAEAFHECENLSGMFVDPASRSYCNDDQGFLFNKDKTVLAWAPYTYKGYYDIPDTVKVIDRYAFYNCAELTGVTIPDGVTTINANAFEWCLSLGDVTIPDSVTYIGVSAFAVCASFVDITIPSSVTYLGASAFDGCGNLVRVNIPDGITEIAGRLFDDCEKLRNIKIPSGVTSIGDYAFSSCESLQNVTIPKTVTEIGEYAFGGCDTFTNIVIPDSVKTIGEHAFAVCDNLSSVTLPKKITVIEDSMFYGCSSLTTVTIPESVKTIGSYAFERCGSLTSVVIPDSVTKIGSEAFKECRNLTKIVVSEKASVISRYAFEDCGTPMEIYFRGSAPDTGGNKLFDENVTAYYPANNPSWTEAVRKYIGTSAESVKWVPYYPHSSMGYEIKNRSDEDCIVIYPVDGSASSYDGDNHKSEMTYVTVTSALGQQVVKSGGFIISVKDAAKQDIVIQKNGYVDYVLPAKVAATMTGKPDIAHQFTAYMQKDDGSGKPCITAVFGRSLEGDHPFIDMRVNTLTVSDVEKQELIIVTRGFESSDVTYCFTQSDDCRITSSTGTFSNQDLYASFDEGALYAYAYDSTGAITDMQKIRYSRISAMDAVPESLRAHTLPFLEGDLDIKIDENLPVVGGAELDLTDFIPIKINGDLDDGKLKLAIGYEHDFENDKDGSKWKDYTDAIDKIYAEPPKRKNPFDELFNTLDVKNGSGAKPNWYTSMPNSLSASVAGYAEGEFDSNGDFVLTEIAICLGVAASIEVVAQGAVWVIPVYGSIGAESEVTLTGKLIIEGEKARFDGTLSTAPGLSAHAGIGVRGACSGGFYTKGTVPIDLAFRDMHLVIKLNGEIGVEAECFVVGDHVALLDSKEAPVIMLDKVFGKGKTTAVTQDLMGEAKAVSDQVASMMARDYVPENRVTLLSRDYADDTSEWLGDMIVQDAPTVNSDGTTGSAAAVSGGVSFTDLQTSIFSGANPQLVTAGDRMILAWAEDDMARDAYNRMRLVYSVYDPDEDIWSAPQAVWDDGYNDGYPVMSSDGENVWITWLKVTEVFNADNLTSITPMLENAQVCVARFDAETGTFTDQQMLTADSNYPYTFHVSVEEGVPAVYWVSAADNSFNDSGCHTIYRWQNGETTVIAEELNYILSVSAAGGEVTYVMDADGDLSTTGDVTAFTLSDTETVVYKNHDAAVVYAGYGMLDGEQTLFISDLTNIYYRNNGEYKSVLSQNRCISGELNVVQIGRATTIVWSEQEEGWNELYSVTYENGAWSAPVQISSAGEKLTHVRAVGYGNKMIGICMANEVTYNKTSGSYDAAAADLCLFKFEDFCDIAMGTYVSFDEEELRVGENAPIYVTVYNNGTQDVERIVCTVSDTIGTELVQTVDVDLPAGAASVVALNYPVPERYAATTLTISTRIEEDEANVSDNTVSVQIGMQDITIEAPTVEVLNGSYILKTVVTNNSLVDAENVVLSVCAGEEDGEVIQSIQIGTIARENYALSEVILLAEKLPFAANNACRVFLTVSADGEESVPVDNQVCTVVNREITEPCLHPVTKTVEALEATCTSVGHNSYEICLGCNAYLTEFVQIPMKDHVYKRTVKKPTCTKDGYTTFTCSGCGDSYQAYKTDNLGHDYQAVVTEPTCTEKGYTTYLCTRCGSKYTGNYTDITAHKYEEVIVQPTCTEMGYISKVCINCGKSYISGYLNPTHDYEEKVVEPSCDSEGYTIFTCKLCGYRDYGNFVDELGHEYTVTVIYPTCTERGYTEYYCKVCGEMEADRYTDPLGHNYRDGYCTACGEKDPDDDSIVIRGTYKDTQWQLTKDGVFTVSGKGAMKNFGDESEVPWYSQRKKINTVVIEEGITSIGSYSFYDCYNMTAVTIPEGVKSIGKKAFIYCTDLTAVTIPDSVTSMGSDVFCGCGTLSDVTIGTGVKTIPENAFYNCRSLTELKLPKNVAYIEYGAFNECIELKNIYFTGNAPDIDWDAFFEVAATAYYPSGNSTWSSDVMNDYGGSLTWASYESGMKPWLDKESPDAPVVKIANVVSSGKIKLTWKAVEGAAKYQVYRSTSRYGSYSLLKTTTGTSLTNTSTIAGKTYYYYVVAVSKNGRISEASDTVSRMCALAQPVVTLSNVASSGKIKVSWGNIEGTEEYEVYRATSKSGSYKCVTITTGTSFTDTTAAAGKTYYYTVLAVAAKYSANSAESEVKSRTCDLAQPTVTLGNVSSSGKIKVSWKEIDGAVKYEVYRATAKTGTYSLLTTTTGTSLTNTSTIAGKTYYYKVKALAEKTAADSAESAVQSRTCDLARPTVTLSNVASSGKIKVSWKKIDGAVKYEVYRATSKTGTYSLIKTTTGTSLTNTSTIAGKTYYYKVKALAEKTAADSAESGIQSCTCDLARPTVTLSNVASSGKIKISWDKVEGAVKYEVYRATSQGGTYTKLTTVTGTSATNTSTTAGKTYYYKVRAIAEKSDANSAYSEVKSRICDLARPVAEVSLNSKGKPVVTWKAISGAVKYTVYIYDSNGDEIKTSSTTSTKLTHSDAAKGKTYGYRVVAVASSTSANSAKSTKVSVKSQ